MKAINTPSCQQEIPVIPTTIKKFRADSLDAEKLIEMIQSKSEKGFNILYDMYCDALYNAIIKIVKRTDITEDLLQDTFIKIWRHIDRFEPEKGTLYTWMLNIAKNQSIDYLRSSDYHKQLLNEEIDLFSFKLDVIDTIKHNVCQIEFADFKRKAKQLDPKYAKVIDMIFFDGWTHKQTALKLMLPIGTVKTRARKGLSLLKTLYLK
ncbi:MAG: RNA polymerase sigma factor [Bacteroidia bacterium]|nr:RNA polymerase sigma factor [Bacteroidia bacterium]